MVGSRKNGVKDALALCEEGVGESCFNLAIMLSAQSRGKGSDETVAQLERALVLLPAPVMQMVLDDWGGGRADEKGDSEAEAEAETQRRLEEILKKARENQEKLEGEGVTDVALDSSTMAGRKGGPVTEADALAPMFFYRPVQAD